MTEQEKQLKIEELSVHKWIAVNYGARNVKYYTNLGYTPYLDYFGKKYWVVKISDLPKRSPVKFLIICPNCLLTREVKFSDLMTSKSNNFYCKACSQKFRKKDLMGQKFGRLTVIKDTGKRSNSNHIIWLCKCDCGNLHEVAGSYLINGNTKSCGCTRQEKLIKRHKEQGHFIKSEHTQEEIREHLEKRSKKYKELANFNKQIAKDREYLCYFTATNEWGNIAVHHINSRDKYPKQVYDFNNLICLRKDIHKLFHQMYGYGNNNVDQFYEFLTLWARNKEVICED